MSEVAGTSDVVTSDVAGGRHRYSQRPLSLCISYFRRKICDRLHDAGFSPVQKHWRHDFSGYGLVHVRSSIYSLCVGLPPILIWAGVSRLSIWSPVSRNWFGKLWNIPETWNIFCNTTCKKYHSDFTHSSTLSQTVRVWSSHQDCILLFSVDTFQFI